MCKLNFLKNLLTLPLAYGIIIPATSLGLYALQKRFILYGGKIYVYFYGKKRRSRTQVVYS